MQVVGRILRNLQRNSAKRSELCAIVASLFYSGGFVLETPLLQEWFSYTINSHDLHCLLRGQYRSWLCFFNYAEVLIQYSIETLYISEKCFSGRYGDRTPDPDFISAPEHCSGISLTYLRSQQKLVT